jgi:ankyrin repeat protein
MMKTPLLWACIRAESDSVDDWIALVLALLTHGANVNVRDCYGDGVLGCLNDSSQSESIAQLAPALFARGVREPRALINLTTDWTNIRLKYSGDFADLDEKLEPLFADDSVVSLKSAERSELFENCVTQGFDRCAVVLFQKNFRPRTFDLTFCTQIAASTGCSRLLKVLRTFKSMIYAPAPFKQTALHLACIHGNKDAALALLDGTNERTAWISALDSLRTDAKNYAERWGTGRGMNAVVTRINEILAPPAAAPSAAAP